MDTYRTMISDKRWIAYDIPGNIGWITWLICAVRGLLGLPIALFGLKKNKKRAAAMLAGSAFCAFFAGLLLTGYKKI